MAERGESSEELRVLVPSVAGGGYDLTARTMVQALADEGTVDADVVVLPGSGGIVGLNRLALESGNPDLLMVMGLGVLGSLEILPSEHTLADVTPIARLVEEPEALLVPSRFTVQNSRRSDAGLGGGSVVDLDRRWFE